MALVWVVECKPTCNGLPYNGASVSGKSADTLVPNPDVGSFECHHCHEYRHYSTGEFIPSEGRVG